MQGIYLRKYGVEAKVNFNLFEIDGVDFRVDAAHAAGDSKIMKDEGAEANTDNGFVDEGSAYSIVVSATEMTAARIMIHLIDQTGPKAWLDDSLVIETYGNASAMHAFDLDTASTPQTGDNYARLGAPAGASVSADIVVIEAQTDDIGVAGAGLSNVPWNSDWDAEVQSEVADAIIAYNLDHLALTATGGADMTSELADNTILSRILSGGDTSAFVPSTDGLQFLRDLLDEIDGHVHGLAGGSAGISTAPKAEPNGFTITTGTSEANDEDSTHALDETTHDIEDDSPNTDVYYEFLVGTEGNPVSVEWEGFANSQGNSYAVYGYDFGNTAWVQIGSISGTAGSTVIHQSFTLTTNLVESGVGTVRIRFYSTDGTKLGTDRILVTYTAVLSSSGIVDEWETQSQAAPTGFQVNVKEVNGTAQTANDDAADINTLISVLGALTDAAAAGDPTTSDTVMQYVKQLINLIAGSTGVGTYPTAQAPGNGVNLLEVLRSVYDDTNELQADDLPTSIAALPDAAAINAQVDAAIETYYLHQLFAANYDPASKPGSATALLNELIENDGGVSRFTANTLEQGPVAAGDATEAKQDTILAGQATLQGADSDTLETLSDQLDGIEGAQGSGAIPWTITVDDGSDGLIDADVWVTSDEAGTNTIASGETNADGQVTFMLDAGTLYLWIQKPGYDFTNPTTITVS